MQIDDASEQKDQQKPQKSAETLWIAKLPIESCDFGKELSYFVPGMSVPAAIAPIPCGADSKEIDPVRFSFVSDTQEGPEIYEKFVEEIAKFPGIALLHGGDIVQTGGHFKLWVDYFNAAERISGNRITYAAVGNHEYRKDDKAEHWGYFFNAPSDQAHQVVRMGAAKVILINSCFEDNPDLIEGQLAWLEKQLSEPTQWKIVAFHHAPFSEGIAQISHAFRKEHLKLREKYVPLFEKYRVDLVLAGHTHLYEHSLKEGIHYLTTGAAGGKMGWIAAKNPYALMPAMKERTVIHFEVTPNSMRATSVKLDGVAVDDLILKK